MSYSAAISACEKARKWKPALSILEGMRSAGVLPNVVSYNAAISACAKCGQWLEALSLFELLNEDREERLTHGEGGNDAQLLEPDYITYNAILDALDMGDQIDLADMIYEDAVCNGLIQHWSDDDDDSVIMGTSVMDLHSFSVPMAKAAVRMVMRTMELGPEGGHEREPEPDDEPLSRRRVHDVSNDLIIITGLGRGSMQGRSVLRPAGEWAVCACFGLSRRFMRPLPLFPSPPLGSFGCLQGVSPSHRAAGRIAE